MTRSFGPFDVGVGVEIEEMCQSWTLDNDETVYVNSVEMTSGPGFHHSNWYYVPEQLFRDNPDGAWPCEEQSFSATAALRGGVVFAQSTQNTHEIQAFTEGAAVAIPPRSRIVGMIHLLNATPEPLSTNMTLELSTIPEDEVEVVLTGMFLQYGALAILPHMESVFTTECPVAAEHERQLERPIDFSIYYMLPHYHSLGTGLSLEAYGPDGDSTIYEADASIGDQLGTIVDPPFSMAGQTGLRFSCEYTNPRDEKVGWGIGDQEMCIFMAFTDSSLYWGGGVFETGSSDEPTMRDGTAHFSRECTVYSIASGNF